MSIKEQIRAEIERRFWDYGTPLHDEEVTKKVDEILDFLDTLPEQPKEGLEEEQTCKGFEEEFRRFIKKEKEKEPDGSLPYYGDYGIYRIARHFAEWGARHSINWGDVQLLDTFILELSREEKDGTDWGDSEKFYTEVLRRFHEFNDKKIPEIVAELGAEHLKK